MINAKKKVSCIVGAYRAHGGEGSTRAAFSPCFERQWLPKFCRTREKTLGALKAQGSLLWFATTQRKGTRIFHCLLELKVCFHVTHRFVRYFLTLVDFDGPSPRISFETELYKDMAFTVVGCLLSEILAVRHRVLTRCAHHSRQVTGDCLVFSGVKCRHAISFAKSEEMKVLHRLVKKAVSHISKPKEPKNSAPGALPQSRTAPPPPPTSTPHHRAPPATVKSVSSRSASNDKSMKARKGKLTKVSSASTTTCSCAGSLKHLVCCPGHDQQPRHVNLQARVTSWLRPRKRRVSVQLAPPRAQRDLCQRWCHREGARRPQNCKVHQ